MPSSIAPHLAPVPHSFSAVIRHSQLSQHLPFLQHPHSSLRPALGVGWLAAVAGAAASGGVPLTLPLAASSQLEPTPPSVCIPCTRWLGPPPTCRGKPLRRLKPLLCTQALIARWKEEAREEGVRVAVVWERQLAVAAGIRWLHWGQELGRVVLRRGRRHLHAWTRGPLHQSLRRRLHQGQRRGPLHQRRRGPRHRR